MIASLATLIGNPFAVITGWTLLLILWETTVVGVVLAVWRTWRPRGSAREQHSGGGGRVQRCADPRGLHTARPVPESDSGDRSGHDGRDVRPD